MNIGLENIKLQLTQIKKDDFGCLVSDFTVKTPTVAWILGISISELKLGEEIEFC